MISDSLYKYMPARGNFFDNFLLRASSRNCMNDPFEILPSTTSLAKFLCDIGDPRCIQIGSDKVAEEFRKQKNQGRKQYAKISVFDETGIISFTETKHNLLMWSTYAESHTGMVIEINTNHQYFNRPSENDNYEGKIHRVRYDRERPYEVKNWFEWFIYKSEEWIYEKEHRFLIGLYEADEFYKATLFDKNPIVPTNRIDGRITPDIHLKEYFCMCKIPENSLISVTLGAEIDKTVQEEILKKIRLNPLLSQLKVFKARTHPDRYELAFNEIFL